MTSLAHEAPMHKFPSPPPSDDRDRLLALYRELEQRDAQGEIAVTATLQEHLRGRPEVVERRARGLSLRRTGELHDAAALAVRTSFGHWRATARHIATEGMDNDTAIMADAVIRTYEQVLTGLHPLTPDQQVALVLLMLTDAPWHCVDYLDRDEDQDAPYYCPRCWLTEGDRWQGRSPELDVVRVAYDDVPDGVTCAGAACGGGVG